MTRSTDRSPIDFYSTVEQPYGVFSNFSRHGFTLDGEFWPTSEHYFQAQKFQDERIQAAIRNQGTAKQAAQMGRRRDYPLRPDWEEIKEEVMYRALQAKFTQNEQLKVVLLGTNDREIVERTTNDYYWGCGSKGNGKNRLGVLLMQLRAELRGSKSK